MNESLNLLYSKWYYAMYKENEFNKNISSKYLKKSRRIERCLRYNNEDGKAKRCQDRFCSYCRSREIMKVLNNEKIKNMSDSNRYSYALTLTIPSVKEMDLKNSIKNMNKSFNRFIRALKSECKSQSHGFKDRIITVNTGIRILEVNYNKNNKTYHPHFHCIIYSNEYFPDKLEKKFIGGYRKKEDKYHMYSDLDIQMMKLWYMSYNQMRISVKEYKKLSNNYKDLYMCDIRSINKDEINRFLRYSLKPININSYREFKIIALALENSRLYQLFG